MNRTLAIDYGEKRIGIALSDPLGITAQAYPFISNSKEFFSQLNQLIEEKSVTQIIIGLPTNRFGEDTQKTSEVRTFSEKVASETGLPVSFQDERYSSKAVERHLIEADVSRKKRKQVIDSQAAAFFLQGYLDKNKRG